MTVMIDEDAFGLLLSYYQIEDDEYGHDDRQQFVDRFVAFERAARGALEGMTLPRDHHLVVLGHAIYVELADAEDTPDLLAAFRLASGTLSAAGFDNVAALTHGSRWVEDGQPPVLSLSSEPPRTLRASGPSEPFRKALYVDALARPDDDVPGWGVGVYVDLDALEALGRKPKNAPTELRACGARFYRIPAREVVPA
jgi:hypothetical protein